jgi:hypothetical protein
LPTFDDVLVPGLNNKTTPLQIWMIFNADTRPLNWVSLLEPAVYAAVGWLEGLGVSDPDKPLLEYLKSVC